MFFTIKLLQNQKCFMFQVIEWYYRFTWGREGETPPCASKQKYIQISANLSFSLGEVANLSFSSAKGEETSTKAVRASWQWRETPPRMIQRISRGLSPLSVWDIRERNLQCLVTLCKYHADFPPGVTHDKNLTARVKFSLDTKVDFLG